MAQGFQIFDGNGALMFNSGDYLPRFVNIIATNAVSGSISDGNLVQAGYTAFAIVFPIGAFLPGYSTPSISISGATISWTYPSGSGNINCYIWYGVR